MKNFLNNKKVATSFYKICRPFICGKSAFPWQIQLEKLFKRQFNLNLITVTCMRVEDAQGLVVGTGGQTIPHLVSPCYVNMKNCLTFTIQLTLQNEHEAMGLHAAKQRY